MSISTHPLTGSPVSCTSGLRRCNFAEGNEAWSDQSQAAHEGSGHAAFLPAELHIYDIHMIIAATRIQLNHTFLHDMNYCMKFLAHATLARGMKPGPKHHFSEHACRYGFGPSFILHANVPFIFNDPQPNSHVASCNSAEGNEAWSRACINLTLKLLRSSYTSFLSAKFH